MASNLLAGGQSVTVFDLSPSALSAVEKNGAKIASSVTDSSITSASSIITMLPSSPHVSETVNKIIETGNVKPGTTFIDSSTIDPSVSKALSDQVAGIGCTMIDAPVSGGVGGAENGTLTFMAGCRDAKDLDSVRELFDIMGSNLVHTGGPGTGCMAKVSESF